MIFIKATVKIFILQNFKNSISIFVFEHPKSNHS